MKVERKEWLDTLRAFATVCVIILHVSAEIPTLYNKVSNDIWWIGNLIDSFVRFCVPIFVMISGALLLGKEYETIDFLKRRFTRVLFPFLFWSFTYILLTMTYKIIEGEKLNWVVYIVSQLRYGSANHLWFVYMLLGIYLFVPIINSWIIKAQDIEIVIFLGIWMLTLFVAWPFKLPFGFNIDLTYFSGYIGYLVLGYFMSKGTAVRTLGLSVWVALMFVLGLVITFAGTYFFTSSKMKFDDSFYRYLTPNICLMSIAVFYFGRYMKFHNKIFMNCIFVISKYSYGIYLVHILVLICLRKVGIYWAAFYPIVSIPLISILCLVLSLTIIYLISKLPYGRYISG